MKIAFFAVDLQKDFMNPDGALYVKGAELIKPKLKEITDFAREKKKIVVNTADCHTKDTKEISDNPDYMTTFPPHCMLLGEGGMDYIEETDPRKDVKSNYCMVCYTDEKIHHTIDRARNIIIYKDAFDVFKGNQFANEVVKRIHADTYIVYGVATNVCVDYAVMGLLERKKKVYVVKDAIKELPNLPIDELYNRWKSNGVHLLDWDEIKKESYNGE